MTARSLLSFGNGLKSADYLNSGFQSKGQCFISGSLGFDQKSMYLEPRRDITYNIAR